MGTLGKRSTGAPECRRTGHFPSKMSGPRCHDNRELTIFCQPFVYLERK